MLTVLSFDWRQHSCPKHEYAGSSSLTIDDSVEAKRFAMAMIEVADSVIAIATRVSDAPLPLLAPRQRMTSSNQRSGGWRAVLSSLIGGVRQ